MKRNSFLLLFAFALRLYFALIYQQFPVEYDAGLYDDLGWNLASGNGFINETGKEELGRGPGYPFFGGNIQDLWPFLSLRAFFRHYLARLLFCSFFARERYFWEETAVLSLLIASFYPPFLSYGGILYAETLFTFLIVLFTYLFLHGIRQKNGGFIFFWELLAVMQF